MTLETLLNRMVQKTSAEQALVSSAWNYAEEAHKEQKRASGEPYFNHLAATAGILADLNADAQTIAAGLLHDSVEDVGKTLDEIQGLFGDEVAFLVDGVTKLGKLKYQGLKRHVESLRKLFIATAEDPRVILIKLADRLHNMQTLGSLPREKQERIATETLEIFAPIAHRLGIGQLKGELEDLAFKIAYPEKYAEVMRLRDERALKADDELSTIAKKLETMLKEYGITVHAIDKRIKHLWSLNKKLHDKDMNIDKVYDIAALRIIVDTVEECYLALGIIHGEWRPLPGRIKDYIATPKLNGYQSLHTTIFTGEGSVVEIQIRTKEMHRIAEFGIASHVSYKEDGAGEESFLVTQALFGGTRAPRWINEFAETNKHENRSRTFIKNLKKDVLGDRIFVFTPRGEVIDLPNEATPIDFAYAIHTDLGDHTSGARVNGKFVALNTKLVHGDIVEIEARDSSHPSPKWLTWVKTSFAKKKIRNALEKET